MSNTQSGNHLNKLTLGGLIVTLGIIYGDIGTSPLYVLKAIIGEGNQIQSSVIFGGISCIFWTLTLQTTIKYVINTRTKVIPNVLSRRRTDFAELVGRRGSESTTQACE